jgi:hypothetical protein
MGRVYGNIGPMCPQVVGKAVERAVEKMKKARAS